MGELDELNDERIERPIWLVISSSLAAFISLAAAIRAPATLRQFRELFKGFGADRPWMSQVVLDCGDWAWWLLAIPGVGIAAWVISRSYVTPYQRRAMKITVRSCSLAVWTTVALFTWAVYAPIFKLGAVV